MSWRALYTSALLCCVACGHPLPGVQTARDRVSRSRHGIAVGFELDGRPARRTEVDLGPVTFRHGLQYSYLFAKSEGKLKLALGGEASAGRTQEAFLNHDLAVELSQFWVGGFGELRFIPRKNMSVLHLRLRISGVGSRLKLEDRVASTSDSDWTANVELAPLFGLRIGSLILLESGPLFLLPCNEFHVSSGTQTGRLPDPRADFSWIVRAAIEFRFGE